MKKKKVLLSTLILLVSMVVILIVRKVLEPVKPYEESINVEDVYLNDANVLDVNNRPEIESPNYFSKQLDYGEFTKPLDSFEKPFFKYETQIRQAVRFRLTPKNNSDYTVTIPNSINLNVQVIQHNLIRYNNIKDTICIVDKNKNKKMYKYKLQKDITYDIYVVNENECPITCITEIEQDNWIYAPFGGYAKYGKNRVSYLSQKLLFETRITLRQILGDDPGYLPEVEKMSKEQLHQYAGYISFYLYEIVNLNQPKDFLKHYDDIRFTDEFLQTITDSEFNIVIITSNSGRRYKLNYDVWNRQNYFYKYRDGKRASKIIAFPNIPDKDEIVNNKGGEWVHYIY